MGSEEQKSLTKERVTLRNYNDDLSKTYPKFHVKMLDEFNK